jgi:hypothetical protein
LETVGERGGEAEVSTGAITRSYRDNYNLLNINGRTEIKLMKE